MNIDLNVESMSREQLESNYFDVVFRLEEFIGCDTESLYLGLKNMLVSQGVSGRYGRTTILSPQSMKFIQLLLSGREISFSAMDAHIRLGDEAKAADQYNLVKSIACRVRKVLKPLGIEIYSIWGRGYVMPKESVDRLKSMMVSNQGGLNDPV